jgi:hypothetical protein
MFIATTQSEQQPHADADRPSAQHAYDSAGQQRQSNRAVERMQELYSDIVPLYNRRGAFGHEQLRWQIR